MQCVNRPWARAAALLVVTPFLAFASALAPQHIHEPGPGHDSDHPVAHSHFGPHAVDGHESGGTEIEHDAERVVWLDSPVLHESIYQASPVPAVPAAACDRVPVERRWTVIAFDDAAPVHGPPKLAHLFRGPPPTSSELI
jgi:hypothetical protein